MKTWLTASLVLFFVGLALSQTPNTDAYENPPAPPDAGLALVEVPERSVDSKAPKNDNPARLSIPAVGIKTAIEPVGINEKGEMAVPEGSSDRVGWYQSGATPGENGSAVMAAHVYAGFKKLRGIQPGAEIEVTDEDGETKRFIVEEVKLTRLEDVSPYFLFERSDAARLNLITCAGKFDRKLGTYDHRLIVYAVLAP